VSISKSRKSKVGTLPAVSKARRTQRRPVEAAMLHGHPFKVNAADLPRRQFLHLAAGASTFPAVSRIARAQTYPSRPVTINVPSPAGGPTDTIGRIIAERMRVSLDRPVIIENVAGAAGSLGVGRAARAAPMYRRPCRGMLARSL
jgi:hypothetical protein